MCLYPRLFKNRKYIANKKNGGNVPSLPMKDGKEDKRVMAVPIGCGNCIECRKQKKREWQVRLYEELKHNKDKCLMITLTFNTKSLKELSREVLKKKKAYGYELDNEIASLAMRRFTENWRSKHKKALRHWAVTELGGGRYEHLHIHTLVWGKDIKGEDIREKWKYGMTWSNDEHGKVTTMKSVTYMVKYISKLDEKHKNYKSKIYASKGIGKAYINESKKIENRFRGTLTNESYTADNGVKLALPIYYRNKLYNEREREILWQKKLDENVRWVDGEKIKIDTKDGLKLYKKKVKEARKKNRELGYSGIKKWNEELYQEQLKRLTIHKNRIWENKEPIEKKEEEKLPNIEPKDAF